MNGKEHDAWFCVAERWADACVTHMSHALTTLTARCPLLRSSHVPSLHLLSLADESAVEEMVSRVLAANPKQLEQYCGGKTKLAGFFTGQVMKESAGRVNPGLMNKVLMKKLKEAADAAAAA